ncbi:hypothetical protein E4T56_gene11978 [Termitomyces sp. T112]|nr:hypothetical protein E4T56_gene11978 [Termitomyces sp. T112]
MAGPSGPLSGTDVMQPPAGMAPSTCSKSGICPGVVQLVPEGSRVVQAEVTPEQFAEAVGQARGPPTHEWCQAAAPCASCTQRGEQCEFEEPASGVWWDTLVCLPCHSRHKKCSITLSWHATCVVAEQGWDRGWVAAQLEEGRKGRVSGRGSGAGAGEWVSAPAMKVGPPWGGWREGAPSTQKKGKWRASPSPEAGPIYSPTSGAPIEQSADRSWSVAEAYLRCWVESLEQLLVAREEEIQGVREERDGAQRELDRVWRERDLAQKDKDVAAWAEAVEVATQQAGGSGAQETQQGSSAGEVQAAAGGMACQRGSLGPARSALEHRILLDGVLAALGSIHDGLARMPRDLLPELGQGVMQMGHLLAGHQQRAMADPGAWWEMATDMGEPLLRQPKVLVVVVAQLEVFMVGRVAGLGSEDEGERVLVGVESLVNPEVGVTPTTAICVGSVPGVPGLGGILSVEVPEFVGGSVEVLLGFPRVVLRSVALPADQVLELAADYPGVKDLIDLIVILVLDFDGGRSAGALAGEGVWSVPFKESNVEHRVEGLQARRQVELVSVGGDLLEDLEWAEAFVVEFDGRPPGLEILPVEPDQGAGGPVGGRLVTGIGMLGVGLVGGVDLVPEELVEGSEVLGDLVGNVGRDVFEEQRELGIVPLLA